MSPRESYLARLAAFFECLGSIRFATRLASALLPDQAFALQVALELPDTEVLAAASFHGDIGQQPATLDKHATEEQRETLKANETYRHQLLEEGAKYKEKFGIKFLVSAKGKTAEELLRLLQGRINNPREVEWRTAREVLFEIAWKRILIHPQLSTLINVLPELAQENAIPAAQCTISTSAGCQTLAFGEPKDAIFEMASLSKSVGVAFAMEYFDKANIPLDTKVNDFLTRFGSDYRLRSAENGDPAWADDCTIEHLMRHNALNLHYVKGIPLGEPLPPTRKILDGLPEIGLDPVRAIFQPGTRFKYSGAGFILLQYLIEFHSGKSIDELTRPWLDGLSMTDFSFNPLNQEGKHYAKGIDDTGKPVPGTRLCFPAFAAGALSTTHSMHQFLIHMTNAYHDTAGSAGISHKTARLMLHDKDSRSLECFQFMGCKMGYGIFILEGECNKFMIHQGANDGFRVIFIHCYAGVDRGSGITAVCSADVKGVSFNAMLCQTLLRVMNVKGISFDKFATGFSGTGLKQEDVVNKGYRHLLFEAFRPDRAEEIAVKGPRSKYADYNVAVGGQILYCTNDRFARSENLISPNDPLFDPELFGRQGKVMDSWESVRHNPQGFDEMSFRLQTPSPIRYILLSSKWHYGNQSPFIRIEAETVGQQWVELIPDTPMDGHSEKRIALSHSNDLVFQTVKVQMKPDGGFSRLGLFADLPEADRKLFSTNPQCERYPDPIPQTKKPLCIPYNPSAQDVADNNKRSSSKLRNVASLALGAKVVHASDEHYGLATNAISPFAPLNMFDGLESARSRKPGSFETLRVQLSTVTSLAAIVVDFQYFVNNNPLEMEVLGITEAGEKVELIKRQRCKQYAGGKMRVDFPQGTTPIAFLEAHCFPCGGLNRLIALAPSPN